MKWKQWQYITILCKLCKFSVSFLKKTIYWLKIKLKWFLLRKKMLVCCYVVPSFRFAISSTSCCYFFESLNFVSFQIMQIIRSFFQKMYHLVVQCLFFFWIFLVHFNVFSVEFSLEVHITWWFSVWMICLDRMMIIPKNSKIDFLLNVLNCWSSVLFYQHGVAIVSSNNLGASKF